MSIRTLGRLTKSNKMGNEGVNMVDKIQVLAHRQLRDYRANQPGTCFADRALNLSINEAYLLIQALFGTNPIKLCRW